MPLSYAQTKSARARAHLVLKINEIITDTMCEAIRAIALAQSYVPARRETRNDYNAPVRYQREDGLVRIYFCLSIFITFFSLI